MSKHNERLAGLQAGREANRKKYLVAEKTEIAEPYEPTWRNKLLMSEDKAMDDLIEALRRDRHACPSTDSAQTFGAAAQDRRFWSKVDRGGSHEGLGL